jgi:hypothetical protein
MEAINVRKTTTVLPLLLFSFLLGIQDGHIALWKDEDPNPLRVFPYRAEMLPLHDQKALEKGIVLENESDLVHLLEDYLS